MAIVASRNDYSGYCLKVNTEIFAYRLNTMFRRKRRIKEDYNFFSQST